MQISVQLYSVRDALAADPAGTLQRLAEAGYTTVEPFDLLGHAEMLERLLPQNGLSAASVHAGIVMAEDPERVFDAAARLGIRSVIEPVTDRTIWTDPARIRQVTERLNALAPLAQRHGVRIGYHNHDPEARTLEDGRTGLEHLVDDLDPAVVLEVDTYWAAVAGADPAALLATLGDRVRLIHLKDGPLDGTTMEQTILGRGEIDVPAVLAACDTVEVGVIEFDDFAGDVVQAVCDSRPVLLDLLEAGRR